MSSESRLRAGSTDFDPSRLTVARRLRGMTKADLARALGVTPTAITQYEKATRPTQAVLAQICLVLGMPREFFGAGNPMTLLPASGAHFRSLRATSAKAREQVLAYGELCLELVELLGHYVDLPEVALPELKLPVEITPEAILHAAAEVRRQWGIEAGPIPSVVQLLEAHGVVVIRLPRGTDAMVDALSTQSGGRPLVFLSPSKDDKARSRFDAAHELGHLVLHPDTEPGSKLVEREANSFASELLMPQDEIFRQLPSRIDWPKLHDLKRHWGVSLRALVFRAHSLGRLSDASYRRANQQLSVWGLPEPGPLGPAESPQMLGVARDLLADHGVDLSSVLAQGRIAVEVTEAVLAAGSKMRPRVDLA
ncbi:ImmA/IrrE family metallo-endopeptidase [Nocardioides alkalitolerans]|uniref:ImmA/IrrE family metallo-endopeptidase n=1 Tax=Nocardioides alkalitolerans TaxID=281714 RepID=UPI00247FC41D|nr:XRE family transcriptional regulator [Nocardioides alkalitolerans]